MKKITKTIISLITTISMTLFVSSESIRAIVNTINAKASANIIYGDIDNNNKIDIYDVVYMRKLLCNSGTEKPEADLNGNNVIDTNDLYLLQSFVSGDINEFPVSYVNEDKDVDRTINYYDPIEQSTTNEMNALAISLKTPEKIYEYVLNNTKIDFYPDSRKGAIGTYEQNCGNDVDCASLLISMFNCIGIKSQYVNGIMTISFDEALNITGANDIYSALRILSFRDYDISYDTVNKTISLKHTWVSSTINGKEYNLDCSYKSYSYNDTLFDDISKQHTPPIVKNVNSINNPYIDTKQYYKGKIALCSKQITNQNISVLPDKLPFQYDIFQKVDKIDNNDSDIITFCLGNNNCSYKSVELYNKKITIEYEISDDLIECSDAYLANIEEGENVYKLMNHMAHDGALPGEMQPVLQINGEKIASGQKVSIGQIQNIPIRIKTMGDEFEYYKECCAGSMYSIVIDYQNMSSYRMTEDISVIHDLSSSVSNSNLFTNKYLGEMLNYIGDVYFSELDLANNMLAEQNDIYYLRGLSIAAIGFEPDISYTIIAGKRIPLSDSIKEAGSFNIDVLADHYISTSKLSDEESEQRYLLAAIYSSSQLESSIIEQILGIEGVSTAKLLDYAINNGINIRTLYSKNANELSTLSINDTAKSILKEYLENTNYVITVPERDIKIGKWQGTGYIIYDPESGRSVFQLTKNTTTNGGASSESLGFREICAQFFAASFAAGSACLLGKVLASFSLGGPLIIVGSVLKLAAVTAMFLASYVNLLNTYDLIGRSASGDVEAQHELDQRNQIDLITSALAACPIAANKMCSALDEMFNEAKYMSKYGTEAVEGAVKNSDDLYQAFKAADNLNDLGIDAEAAKEALKYGDTFISDFGTIINKEPNLANIINSASDKEKAMLYLTKYGDVAVADYLEVGADGIDMLIDNMSKMPDDISNIWSKSALIRGKEGEMYVASTEYRTWYHIGNECNGYYPVIDFQKDRTIVSFKTLNPSSKSYTPEKVLDTISNYAEALGDFSLYNGTDWCNEKILDIRVPKGMSGQIDMQEVDDISKEFDIIIKIGELG